MTLAHLSDTHLGFRAYGRTTDQGVNQREVDVMKAFQTCLDAILERDPDLVVHSGDLFHMVRPSNTTIVGAFQRLARFQAARKHRPFVLIGGNHDTPKLADSGSILKLFQGIDGVRVVTYGAEVLDFPELDLEVLAVPDQSLRMGENIEYAPVMGRTHSVLALHGVEHSLLRTGQGDIDIAETRHERWSYVALGDYHIFRPFGKNVCYAGATEFASNNIWEEINVPKCWVWFDTDTGALEPVPVPTRTVRDLPKIDAAKLEPREVEKRLVKHAELFANDELPIVRQVVTNAHQSLRARLDQSLIRDLGANTLTYQLDLWPANRLAVPGATSGGEARPTKSLEQRWEEHASQVPLPPGIAREDVKSLGIELLKEVEREAAPAEA